MNGKRVRDRLAAIEVRVEERHVALLAKLDGESLALRAHLDVLNHVADTVRTERSDFVRRDWLEARLKVIERTVWVGIGGGALLIAVVELALRHAAW